MNQLTMTGDDWTSDRDRKAQAKAEAARRKAAVECAKKLVAAIDALHAYSRSCREIGDGSEVRGASDGRILLAQNMREYAGWLDSVYGERA